MEKEEGRRWRRGIDNLTWDRTHVPESAVDAKPLQISKGKQKLRRLRPMNYHIDCFIFLQWYPKSFLFYIIIYLAFFCNFHSAPYIFNTLNVRTYKDNYELQLITMLLSSRSLSYSQVRWNKKKKPKNQKQSPVQTRKAEGKYKRSNQGTGWKVVNDLKENCI